MGHMDWGKLSNSLKYHVGCGQFGIRKRVNFVNDVRMLISFGRLFKPFRAEKSHPSQGRNVCDPMSPQSQQIRDALQFAWIADLDFVNLPIKEWITVDDSRNT